MNITSKLTRVLNVTSRSFQFLLILTPPLDKSGMTPAPTVVDIFAWPCAIGNVFICFGSK